MMLNFFSRNIIENTAKFFVFCCLIISGCNSYQSPAPIYGRSTGTNPYENKTIRTSRPTDQKKITHSASNSEQTIENQRSASLERKPTSQIQKKSLSPAVIALVTEADKDSRAGDLESAVVTIERALRIDPRNPTLTYKLALLRLKQSKPRLAEDLAKKAALLAANDPTVKKKSWYLIGEARRKQKNYSGAKEAKIKADSI